MRRSERPWGPPAGHGPPFGRRHGPPFGRRHGRPPVAFFLARGIHRSLVLFLLLAALVGGLAGAAIHAGLPTASPGWLCAGAALILAIWPLAWAATFRIVWPLRELADVAGDLRGGRIDRREDIPASGGEVGEVADALRGMADRVARQLADQRALMAAVSHELRSPLARARVLVELAREGTPAYDDLQAEIDAMDALVGDLLAAARIDFEAIAPRPLPPADLARRALELAHLPAEALRLDGADSPVLADPTLAARALAGVLDNARRYGAATITLTVRARATRVRFEVDDDGPGFGDTPPEQAFQPFWRGPTPDGRPAPRGEGLGLALVRQIALAHGGEAGAENRPGGGARVWVELPTA